MFSKITSVMSTPPVIQPVQKFPPDVIEVEWGKDYYFVLKVDFQWQVFTRTCDSPVDSRYIIRLGEEWDNSYAIAFFEASEDNYDGEELRHLFYDADKYIMAHEFTPGTVGDPLSMWDLRVICRALKIEIPQQFLADLTRVFWIVGHEYGLTVGLDHAVNCYVNCTTEKDQSDVKHHYFHLQYSKSNLKSNIYTYRFPDFQNKDKIAEYFVERVKQLPEYKDQEIRKPKEETTEVTPYPIPRDWNIHLTRACDMV